MRRIVLSAAALAAVAPVAACGSGTPAASVTITSTKVVAPTTTASSSPAGTPSSTAPTTATTSTAAAPTAPAPTRTADATVADLQAATVPAYCQMPSHRLVGGTTAARYKPKGGDVIPSTAVRVDLDGDGAKEIVGEYNCSAGNVYWPTQVLAVWSGGRTLAYDLSRDQEHSRIATMKPDGAGVAIAFGSYEGAGMEFHRHVGRLTYQGGRLVWKNTESPRVMDGSEAQAFFDGRTAPAAAPSQSGATRVSGLVSFVTPSGLTACSMTDESASCEVSGPTFTAPPEPDNPGDLAYGDAVSVGTSGKAGFLLHGDTAFGYSVEGQPSWWQPGRDTRVTPKGMTQSYYALGYGHTLTNGTFTCTVAPSTGVTCTAASGHGFTLSRGAYRLR